jgi:hypothetical protein
MDTKETTATWTNQSILLICEDHSYYSTLREILRPLHWSILHHAVDFDSARTALTSIDVDFIMIVESRKIIITEMLRVLHRTERGRLTPTLVITNFKETLDLQILQSIYGVRAVTKPLIPNHFITVFEEMLNLWQTPALSALRRLGKVPASVSPLQKILVLEKLGLDKHASSYALQAITVIEAQHNNHREAEKRLLDAFRANPNNPPSLALCAWFYLDAKAPHFAAKFLSKLKQMSPKSVVLNIDLAITHLALGDLEKANEYLKEWNDYFPGNQTVENHIAKLMVASGDSERQNTANVSRTVIKRVAEVWQKFFATPQPLSSTDQQGSKAS